MTIKYTLCASALALAGAIAAPTAASADPVPYPGMAGDLSANASPTTLDAGPLGKIAVTGVASGIAQYQDSVFPGDTAMQADVTNGQVFINKTTGVVQFFIQAGLYSIPDLGAPYFKATTATKTFWGALPQAFIKIVPNAQWSFQAGKLPTLIGAESTFSFENMNVQRGLLWNQENAVNRGVQVNYTKGPLAVSVSYNDGFYSNRWNWVTGSAAFTLSKTDTLAFIGGGNLSHTNFDPNRNQLVTPFLQNNGSFYNLILTHTQGPWVIQPYIQYTHVPVQNDPLIGHFNKASTYGGALLASYALKDPAFHLAGRFEYIASTGNPGSGGTSLLYGPGSKALSVTFTPTYQKGIFFVRGEYSYTHLYSTTPGFALGPNGVSKKQNRLLIEGGFLF